MGVFRVATEIGDLMGERFYATDAPADTWRPTSCFLTEAKRQVN